MLNLKKGQEITAMLGGRVGLVEIIADGGAFISFSDYDSHWYTEKEIFERFILPKEKWVPKEGDAYYFFDTDLSIRTYISDSTFEDMAGIKVGNCFQTESEAQKVVEEIKKLLNK